MASTDSSPCRKPDVGTAAVIPIWTSTATTGNCRWRLTYRTVGGDDTTSLDQTTNEQQVSVTDAAPGAGASQVDAEPIANCGELRRGRTVDFLSQRNDDTATDTMAADAFLFFFDLIFQYADV